MRVSRIITRIPHYALATLHWKKNDVLLVSYPKSGNTWLRYIVANYLSLTEMDGNVITFKELDSIMPGFGISNFFHAWNFKIPKFAASHLKYGIYFKKPRTVLILRDPRDVMVSLFHYRNNKKTGKTYENIYQLITDKKEGLDAWTKHTMGWLKKADVIIKYEDLLANDTVLVKDMFAKLNIDYDEDKLNEAVENSRFDKFKKVEKEHGHSKPDANTKDFSFARKGVVGDHKNYFTEKENDYYQSILRKYNLAEYSEL